MPLISIRLFREFLARPLTTGSAVPSTAALARAVTRRLDWGEVRFVAEIGPGTGALTARLVRLLRDDARLLLIEINPRLARSLSRRFAGIRVYLEDAINLPSIVRRERITPGLDAVICSLPLWLMRLAVQRRHVESLAASLRPGGSVMLVIPLHRLLIPGGRRAMRLARDHFQIQGRPRLCILNLPPMLVYHLTLKSQTNSDEKSVDRSGEKSHETTGCIPATST